MPERAQTAKQDVDWKPSIDDETDKEVEVAYIYWKRESHLNINNSQNPKTPSDFNLVYYLSVLEHLAKPDVHSLSL